jgi:hypothetical protein
MLLLLPTVDALGKARLDIVPSRGILQAVVLVNIRYTYVFFSRSIEASERHHLLADMGGPGSED